MGKGMKAYGEGTLEKGDTVAVNLQSNRAPVAVGTAWLSSEDMYMAGRRGKCAGILHFYGDQLWAAGSCTVCSQMPGWTICWHIPAPCSSSQIWNGSGNSGKPC